MSTASNKAKARLHEQRTAAKYREIGYGEAQREGKRAPSLDVEGLPFACECKKRNELGLPGLVRKMAAAHPDTDEWVIHYEPGDRRKNHDVPNVVCLPEDWWFRIQKELKNESR